MRVRQIHNKHTPAEKGQETAFFSPFLRSNFDIMDSSTILVTALLGLAAFFWLKIAPAVPSSTKLSGDFPSSSSSSLKKKKKKKNKRKSSTTSKGDEDGLLEDDDEKSTPPLPTSSPQTSSSLQNSSNISKKHKNGTSTPAAEAVVVPPLVAAKSSTIVDDMLEPDSTSYARVLKIKGGDDSMNNSTSRISLDKEEVDDGWQLVTDSKIIGVGLFYMSPAL